MKNRVNKVVSVGGYMAKKMIEAQEGNKDADNYNKNKKICIKRK